MKKNKKLAASVEAYHYLQHELMNQETSSDTQGENVFSIKQLLAD